MNFKFKTMEEYNDWINSMPEPHKKYEILFGDPYCMVEETYLKQQEIWKMEFKFLCMQYNK